MSALPQRIRKVIPDEGLTRNSKMVLSASVYVNKISQYSKSSLIDYLDSDYCPEVENQPNSTYVDNNEPSLGLSLDLEKS